MLPSSSERDTSRSRDASDGIDLLTVVAVLCRGKLLVACTTILFVLLACLYLFFVAKPRYEAAVYLDEPFAGTLAQLNEGRTLRPSQGSADVVSVVTNLKPYTPQDIFSYTQRFIGSDTLLQQQIRGVLRSEDGEQLKASLLEDNRWRVQVTPPNPKGRQLYRASAFGHSQQAALDDLRHYLELVRSNATDALLADTGSDVQLAIDNLRRIVDERRAVAYQQRQDQIILLTEALQIAKAADLKEPQFTVAQAPGKDSLRSYLDGSALYARGMQALEAELKLLSERRNDDAYIENLREYEARLRRLESIKLDALKGFVPYRLDGEIYVSETPVSPKKGLVLALASLLGAMAGMIFVLGRYVWSRVGAAH